MIGLSDFPGFNSQYVFSLTINTLLCKAYEYNISILYCNCSLASILCILQESITKTGKSAKLIKA
jgi:hypothetical protein